MLHKKILFLDKLKYEFTTLFSNMKIVLTICCLISSLALYGQKNNELLYPAIEGYGGVIPLEGAILPTKKNKVIIDITMSPDDPGELNLAYDRIARLINLYHFSGSKKGDLELAVITHSGATYSVLNDESYEAKFGVSNPNLEIIERLKSYGVQIMVCGQALIKRGFQPDNLNEHVDLALSAITTLTDYQKNGFSVLYY